MNAPLFSSTHERLREDHPGEKDVCGTQHDPRTAAQTIHVPFSSIRLFFPPLTFRPHVVFFKTGVKGILQPTRAFGDGRTFPKMPRLFVPPPFSYVIDWLFFGDFFGDL